MFNTPTRIALAATLVLAAATPAALAEEGGPQPESQWLLHGGFDLGRNHSRGVTSSVDYTGRNNATALDSRYWDAGAAFSRSQSTVKATRLRPSAETRTGSGDAYASYGTERWRGVLGFDATKDEGFRKSQRVSAGVDFAHNGFAANLTASRRRTVFDDFILSVQAARFLGISLPAAVNLDCSITDKGIGARLGYQGASWGAYASGNSYHYDKAACSANFALPDVLRRLSDSDFFALGGRFFDRARGRVGGRIGQNSRLLKNEFGVGFNLAWGLQWSVDYLRSKDQFGAASTSNYSLTGTLGLASNVSLDMTIGNTSGDGGGAQYLGLMLAVAM